ncbi:beta-galactosidase [Microbacterium sp. gxy059]|uniref:glycoside hydrolase family 35 protein n=1 Tax=Microbacterium sp. gxy059 TaxID=2957199 RepID=UPI003D96B144
MTRDAAVLTWHDGRFLKNGEPHRILAGSMHSFRVHPAQWRDRLQRLADLGLNTVDTYVAWNMHQPRRDEAPSFDGWCDLPRFVETAGEVGLDVIVRPGPYICAEWDNGGLPVWLTAGHPALRTSDPRFLDPVARWFDELLPRLAPLQASAGGPIVAFQVENEFGSFGDDPAFVPAMRDLMTARGIVELTYTADGPTELMVDAGTIDGSVMALNLGSRIAEARAFQQERRPGEPFLVGEFWNGWFDHWEHPHHVRDAEGVAEVLGEIVADGGSVSIYMAHGGTNFGTWAGANRVDGELRPTVTSYDSDAPIAEDGRLTAKFHTYREVLGATAPIVSPEPRFVEPRTIPVTRGSALLPALDTIAGEARTLWNRATFEELGHAGALLRAEADVLLPNRPVPLVIEDAGDRVLVFLDGAHVGTIRESGSLELAGDGARHRLTLVTERLGRVNYGHRLGEPKGLVAPVTIERRMIQRWDVSPLPVEEDVAAALRDLPADASGLAGVAHARFDLEEALDAHLALPGFGKGFVWVNGFLLGRHWEVGPQVTLYVPAPLLRAGENEIVVLDLERRGAAIELRDEPELGPREQFIEEF